MRIIFLQALHVIEENKIIPITGLLFKKIIIDIQILFTLWWFKIAIDATEESFLTRSSTSFSLYRN